MEEWTGQTETGSTHAHWRGETEDKNVTRQPKSCYATADLLTHISRKGAGETGAKCPTAHNTAAARANRQEQHPPDPLTPTQLTRTPTGQGQELFRYFWRFLLKRKKPERDSFCVGESLSLVSSSSRTYKGMF